MKLSNIQKYAIQGMVAEGKTAAEISKILDKPESVVVNYVFKLAQSIVKVEAVKAESPVAQVEEPVEEQLVDPFVEHEQALETPKFTQENIKEAAIAGRKKSGEFIINETQSRNKGVSIMTGAASALAEERAKNYNHQQTRNQSAIFKPKGN